MKAKHLLTLVLLLLSLTACAKQEPAEVDTTPTLPSLPQEKGPLELLTEAIGNAINTASRTIQYGTVTKAGDQVAEDIHSQSVSADHPFDTASLYEAVPDFPTNQNFLADFCANPVRAIPSNDGTFRYELTELSWDELWALLYGPSTPELKYDEFSQIICTAAIEVDANGRFSRLEFTAELYEPADQLDRTVTFFLSISDFSR